MENKDAVALVNEIDDLDFSPNEWEEGFLNDMREWVDKGLDLTPRQGNCLEKIYKKASGGGDYERRQHFN